MFWLFFILIVFLVFAFLLTKYLFYRRKPYFDKSVKTWDAADAADPDDVVHSVFLLGDSGAPSLFGRDPVLGLLMEHLQGEEQKKTVVFLGDNIYPKGLPPEDHKSRPVAEQRLKIQLDAVKKFVGNIILISGNHDWNRGMKGGLERVIRQEVYVENYLGKSNIFLPSGGCPGPVEVPLNEKLTLVVINTQWWVQRGEVPIGKSQGCTVESEDDFFEQFGEMLKKNKLANKQVIIVAHHPLYSNSQHGGKFPVKEHLFPLSALVKRFYLPLPLIGSIYPYYRRFVGPKEDMSNPSYRRMRKRLLEVIDQYENLIYAAGHDHNLQYFFRNKNHFIVSGSASKVTYVKRGGNAVYSQSHLGFFEIRYLKDGSVWMLVWQPSATGTDSQLAFRTRIY